MVVACCQHCSEATKAVINIMTETSSRETVAGMCRCGSSLLLEVTLVCHRMTNFCFLRF